MLNLFLCVKDFHFYLLIDLKECLISKIIFIVIHLSVVFPIKYKLIVIKVLNDGFLIPNPRFCEAPEIHSVNLYYKKKGMDL